MRFNRLFTAVVILLAVLILGACQPIVVPTPVPPTEDNKALVRRFYDEVWNQGNLAVADELAAADFVNHNPVPGTTPDLEGFKQLVTQARAGSVDLDTTVEDMVAEGDKVTVRVTQRGTDVASGKQFTLTWIDILRVEDGKAVERWGEADLLGFFTQVDIIPPLEEIGALQAENRMLKEIAGPPPASLDKLYPPEAPAPLYALAMLEMEGAAVGAISDLMQGDMENAVANWEQFKQKYVETSQMVPEWTDKFPTDFLDAGGEALKAGDVEGFFAALEPLGPVCGGCHVANMANVQYRYAWPDFGEIQVSIPGAEEPASWGDLMQGVGTPMVGIGNDLAQGQLDNARQNYQAFKAGFGVMTEACDECHDTPREYFVDARVQADIDALGEALQAESPDAEAIGGLIGKIGEESCGKCHMVHEPAALARDRWEMAQPSGE